MVPGTRYGVSLRFLVVIRLNNSTWDKVRCGASKPLPGGAEHKRAELSSQQTSYRRAGPWHRALRQRGFTIVIAFPLGGDGGRADSLASVAAATSALDASPNDACGPISRNPRARCMKRSRRGRPDIISTGFRNMVKTSWEREEADPGCSPEASALHTPRPSAHTSLQLAGLAQCLS